MFSATYRTCRCVLFCGFDQVCECFVVGCDDGQTRNPRPPAAANSWDASARGRASAANITGPSGSGIPCVYCGPAYGTTPVAAPMWPSVIVLLD